ncbi:hypothetical protein [Methanosarcina barkeri]|uniref:hypothetical protein n=1 Tax=Methanosarcina barkeri TaxID=2208 RepID=UPI0006D26E71|nr:hypothetical protein [Methanosarcina barkeri]
MRVAIITQGVSNVFESVIESGHEVVGIVECSRTREPNSFLKAIGGVFTDAYYSFTSKPLNLKTFSKKTENSLLLLKERRQRSLSKMDEAFTARYYSCVFYVSSLEGEYIYDPKTWDY